MSIALIPKGIVVIGSVTIDKIITEDRNFIKLGGVTTYSGITYSRLGIKSHIICNLAARDLLLLDKLYEENIVVYNGDSDQTTCFVNYIRGDERYQEIPQRAKPIESGQIKTVMDRFAGVHLGPLHPLDIEIEALNFLGNSDLAIFLDVQGYTRMIKNEKVCPSVSEHLATGLSAAQVVKADGAEINAILDYYHMSLPAVMTKFKIQESVITLGPRGGFVQKQDGALFHYDACKIDAPVDSTGAGDVFFAAYIVSRFSEAKATYQACRRAAQIAAQQVEGKYITADTLTCFK